MQAYEYRVTSAPRRGAKAKGIRTPEARFAFALEAEMNRMAAEGWEYVRSDTLPCEEHQGWLRGRATVPRTVLVFRRALPEEAEAPYVPPAYVAPVRAAQVRPPPTPASAGHLNVGPVDAAPVSVAPVRAAEPAAVAAAPPATQAPVLEEPSLAAPPFAAPGPTLPPVLSPPPAAPFPAAPPVASPAVAGPAATTILAAPRRAQVPPPFRPRDGAGGAGPSGTAPGQAPGQALRRP